MSLKTLKLEELEDGKIIRITIDRPQRLNAMNEDFFTEIRDAFRQVNNKPNARVVILQAAGRIFTAGLDLKEMAITFAGTDALDPARQSLFIYNTVKRLQEPFKAVYECRVPVLVGIHNLCIGGGIDLICTADLRYCTKDAQFTIKEIDIGMAADIGTMQFFPKRVGNDSAFRELAYTGRNMGSDEALRIGLVSKVFEDKAQLEAGLLETAKIIATKSPIGIYTLKQVMRKAESKDLNEGLEHIARLNSVMLQTKDTVEAIGAFMQKKKPQFPKL